MKPLYVVIIALVVAGAAFFGGMKFQQSKSSGNTQFRQFQRGPNGQNGPSRQGGGNVQGRFGGGRPVMGEIISKDDNSITVKMQDSSTKIVILSNSTSINMASEGTKSDLTEGTKVGVFGNENPDGSVTAQNVQINPTFRGIGGTGTPQ